MSFLYPLGLLGLIGIPILIIIYILKNKYTEQTISSNYIWKLSEKFLKNKNPISKLSNILSLILQILAIICISLAIAQPSIVLQGQARDYCFILDGSGSMNVSVNGETRLDAGKNEIHKIINDSTNGSTYTLIYSSETTSVIYEELTNKERANTMLDSIVATQTSSRVSSALPLAQSYFEYNRSAETYLITDQNYQSNNINIINVATSAINYAINEVTYQLTGESIVVNGKVSSYNDSTTLNLELYIDNIKVSESTVSTVTNTATDFSMTSTNTDFDSIRVVITNTDNLSYDNEYIIYNLINEHSNKALLVSENGVYIEFILNAVGKSSVEVITPKNYSSAVNGYGLYIFDNCSPASLPTDGTIWFINLSESIPGTGFTYKQEISSDEAIYLTQARATTSLAKALQANLLGQDLYVSKYQQYGTYYNFTNIYTISGAPVIFTGQTPSGNREVVFAFDFEESNLALTMDFITLINNLVDYSFPVIIDESNYECGDEILLNVISGAINISVTTPRGVSNYLDISSETTSFVVTEAGTYTVSVELENETRIFNIYSSLKEDESNLEETTASIALVGNKEASYRDGYSNISTIIFILLAVIIVADWMVYCYEQYQLR